MSGNRSRDISTEAMLPRVQRARPTMYWLECLRSLGMYQLVVGEWVAVGKQVLGQGICYEGQNFLVLVEQQHSAQVTQTLVGKARGSQQLETFYLAKMGSLAESKQV
jgi:hypothetical protein